MKILIHLLCFTVIINSSGQINTVAISSPPTNVTLFGEGLFSTFLNERDFAITPDRKEIFFTVSTPKSTFQTIVFSKMMENNKWSVPEVVSFAGKFSDLEPALSADGNTMYFASNRPVDGTTPKDFDIWRVSRVNNSWGTPENLGSTINSESDEFYPSITKSGNIYFTASYSDGPGREDIYVSNWVNGKYQKPLALDSAVNSKYYEFNAFVSPDERYIIFTSYGRKDDMGGGDLYMSTKDTSDKWLPAKNLSTLNSKQLDYCPYVTDDGKAMFFTSDRHKLPISFDKNATYQSIVDTNTSTVNGNGNIYWVDFKKVLESKR